jgi:hypothetical protein
LLALAICSLIIASCGGVGSDGSGAPPQAQGNGTVTGYGSVIVDGVAFDDRGAATVTEVAPGKDVVTETRLGDRLEVVSASAGVAKTLRVEPTVVGSVSALVVNGFVALGQTVLVNTDAGLGPVTQLDGFASTADVRVGDMVEVHGVYKSVGTAQVVQATRIMKRVDSPAFVRVAGLVQGLSSGMTRQFQIGALTIDYGAATLAPEGAVITEGAAVVVFAPPDHLSTPTGGALRLAATAVRVKNVRSNGFDTYASGIVSQLDATAGRFKLDGLTVAYAPANVAPAGVSLTNGMYVQARGMVGADGVLTASLVTVRDGRSQPESELKGTVVGFDSVAGTFSVRDVLVTLGSASLEACPAGGLANGLFVEVEGAMNASGVTAKEIHCTSEAADSTVEREGVASAVDTTASTFTLLRTGSTSVAVSWSALTYFGNVTPQTLSGAKVEVEGVVTAGVLQASKIKRED